MTASFPQAVVNAGGTTFDHARLEALLGFDDRRRLGPGAVGETGSRVPTSTSEGLFETLPLGAQIVSAHWRREKGR